MIFVLLLIASLGLAIFFTILGLKLLRVKSYPAATCFLLFGVGFVIGFLYVLWRLLIGGLV
jgi:hypothetical protein